MRVEISLAYFSQVRGWISHTKKHIEMKQTRLMSKSGEAEKVNGIESMYIGMVSN